MLIGVNFGTPILYTTAAAATTTTTTQRRWCTVELHTKIPQTKIL